MREEKAAGARFSTSGSMITPLDTWTTLRPPTPASAARFPSLALSPAMSTLHWGVLGAYIAARLTGSRPVHESCTLVHLPMLQAP